MHNDNKKSTAYLVLTGVLASQFVVNESVASAQGFLTNSEILLNKEGANSNETTNNLDYNAVEKVDLSKELEKDENTETEQKLTYEDIDESSIRAPKEELDSKELAKRLIIPIFSFASVGAATGIINHLVFSKKEQKNKEKDIPLPDPNPKKDPGSNSDTGSGNTENEDIIYKFLNTVSYTVLSVILLWLFGKFVIAPLYVLRVYDNEGLKLLTEPKVRSKKVEFIINEIGFEGEPPGFIIEAAEKKLIKYGDQIQISNSLEYDSVTTLLKNIDKLITNDLGFWIEKKAREYTFVDIAEVANMCEKLLNEMKLSQAITNREKSETLFVNMSNSGEKSSLKMAIHGIIASYGDMVNMTWTRCDKKYIEDAIKFLEKDGKTKDNLYVKGRIAATKLYGSILLKAKFGIRKNGELFAPNGKDSPGGVEIFQMLLCMEKLLDGDDWKKFGLPVYKSLLIEIYYYSILNNYVASKDKEGNKAKWDKIVFEKVKELKDIGENLNKEGLLEKIRNLKEFLQGINSNIKADELNNKVNGSILQNNYQ